MLTRLQQLRCLDLDGTAITNAALTTVGRLITLEELWLEGTAITDVGLTRLTTLANLRFISLEYCESVSDAAIAALRSSLPLLQVH